MVFMLLFTILSLKKKQHDENPSAENAEGFFCKMKVKPKQKYLKLHKRINKKHVKICCFLSLNILFYGND